MKKHLCVLSGLMVILVSGVSYAQSLTTFPPEVVKTPLSKVDASKKSDLRDAKANTAQQEAARKAIAAQYASIEKATLRSELPGIMKVIAPDFQYHDINGAVTDRIGYERLQVETLKTRTKLRYAYTIKSIEWRGPDAIVQVESRSTGTYEYKKFDLRTTSRDYWSPSPQGWLLRQRVDFSIRGFVNGKRVSY